MPRVYLHLILLSAIVILFLHVSKIARTDVPAAIAALDALHDDSKPANITHPPRVLLVSAFFPLPNVKHTSLEYASWLAHFLGPITTPIYFYTPPTFAPTVSRLRGSGPITVDTSLNTPFDIPPLRGRQNLYTAMHTQDREKRRHTPELYAVWNAKPWMLEHALRNARAAGEEYDYAFWCDAGSFRAGHEYQAWPDARGVAGLFSDLNNAQIFIPLFAPPPRSARLWAPGDGPLDAEVAEGSFFGGTPHAIASFAALFYAFHDAHAAQGKFVGKDQTLINALLLMHPGRFRTVLLANAHVMTVSVEAIWGVDSGTMGACGAEWFYYQFVLACGSERGAMREVWVQEAAARSVWGAWEWWRKRQGCRLSRAVGVDEVFYDALGPGWEPPTDGPGVRRW